MSVPSSIRETCKKTFTLTLPAPLKKYKVMSLMSQTELSSIGLHSEVDFFTIVEFTLTDIIWAYATAGESHWRLFKNLVDHSN